MSASKKLIVLDVDDTLYLERDYVRSGFRSVSDYVKEQTGAGGFFEKAWGFFESGVRGQIFDLVVADMGFHSAELSIGDLVKVYRAHSPEIEVTDDARDFLNRVSGHNWIAIVTDGPVESQRAKVNALGLRDIADQIIITSERGKEWGKPSILAFNELQKQFDAMPYDCVYYGDNPRKDFIGPRLLRWATVRVRRYGGLHFELYGENDADRTCAHFCGEMIHP